MDRVRLIQGDITDLAVDAIVNAAHESLLGGGGVDGAIHAAAGPALLDACRAIPEVQPGVRCPAGESRITPGFELRARYAIHTVGPIWEDGVSGEDELLANCYRSALALAREHGVVSIAFPAISCGVFGFPVRDAAAIVANVLVESLASDRTLERVLLVAFESDVHDALSAVLSSK